MKLSSVYRGKYSGVIAALVLMSVYSMLLSAVRVAITGSNNYLFLIWNLFLAWVPLLFAWLLFIRTDSRGLLWSRLNIFYFIVWVLFLPNALYLVTDFVHLTGYFDDPQRLFDIVLFAIYAMQGIVLGCLALLLIHIRATQRFGRYGHAIAAGALFASGFAIYMGRYLRWNSWDVVINPFGLLFDVSDRIINPTGHIITFSTTLLFFSMYAVLYYAVWQFYVFASKQR